ncbi:hypothetical protein HK099_006850, partial [Clydaea vesicula]
MDEENKENINSINVAFQFQYDLTRRFKFGMICLGVLNFESSLGVNSVLMTGRFNLIQDTLFPFENIGEAVLNYTKVFKGGGLVWDDFIKDYYNRPIRLEIISNTPIYKIGTSKNLIVEGRISFREQEILYQPNL